MNLARWTFLFLSTVGIGMAVSLLVGLGLQLADPEYRPEQIGLVGFGYNLIGTAIVGAMLGAFSHMGFFAYLTVNLFAQGFFRSSYLWAYVQVFFIIVVTVYSAVFRIPEGGSVLPFFLLPVLVALASVPVALKKVKETNKQALVPTLFFLIAVTLLESVPALRQYNPYATVLMVMPLFACNAWQILQLHRLLGTRKEPASRAS